MSRYVKTPGGLIVPASFAEISPEMGEVASTGFGRDITRGFLHPLVPLQPLDSVLLARGNGNYRIYREVLRDDQVKTCLADRQRAVVAREWEVIPGGDGPREEEAAEQLRETLRRINFDRVTEKMLYGVFYGYAVSEVLWEIRDGRVDINQIRVRDRERFRFDGAMRLRLMTMQSPSPGEELPDRKFWHFETGADHDDEPYGLGLAHWLYWPVFFKRGGVKLWLTFLDKFGAPTAKGEYPAGATDLEKNKLLQALEAIHSESGVIVPEGMAIELLEAARSGEAGYTSLYDRMDAAIAKVIIGQTASSQGTPGKLGNDDGQQEVRADLVKADADLICGSFNRTVARWLCEYNFGPDVAPPEVWRKMEEEEDLGKVAERDSKLNTIGYRRTPESMEQVYGPGYELVERSPALQPPALGPEFAETGTALRTHKADQAQISSEADRLAEGWERLMRGRVEKLLAYAEESGDLEGFRERLGDLIDEPPDEEMRKALARAGFASRLWGALRARRDRQ